MPAKSGPWQLRVDNQQSLQDSIRSSASRAQQGVVSHLGNLKMSGSPLVFLAEHPNKKPRKNKKHTRSPPFQPALPARFPPGGYVSKRSGLPSRRLSGNQHPFGLFEAKPKSKKTTNTRLLFEAKPLKPKNDQHPFAF